MDVIDAIHRRRSVRNFTTQPVEPAALLRLIDAAISAPSALNEQPWHFTVVQDLQKLDAISTRAKAHLLASPQGTVPSRLIEILRDPSFQVFYRASVLIVISAVPAGNWAVEDCALAAENLMLAASAEGLGTCWIGFAQAWLQTAEGKKTLELPSASLPVAPIIVGHPVSAAPAVSRREARIHWLGQ